LLRLRPTHWLVAVLILGAVLRFVPIWFGLPYLNARPDEETAVGLAVKMLDGDVNPHFFHWPSLTFYVFAALFRVASAVSSVFSAQPLSDAAHLLLARGLVALAGTATIAVLFAMARRMADAPTALLAALLLAVSMLHVRESHFAMADVLMTLLVTASLALTLRALDGVRPASEAQLRLFAAAGLTGGLAASTKYNAAAILAAMAAAQVLLLAGAPGARWRVRTWTPSLAYAVCFALGFLVATPYALLDWPTFIRDVTFDVTHLSEGHNINLGRGWLYHLRMSLPYGLGMPTFAAAAVGLVVMPRRHPRQALVVSTFLLALYGVLGSGYTVFFRYILPLVPCLCLVAAIVVRETAAWVSARFGMREAAALAVLTLAVAGPALVNVVWFDVLLARTDTRVLAARWLMPRVRPGDALHEAGGTYARLDLTGLRYHDWSFDEKTESFGHPEGRPPDWLVFYDSPLWTYARVPAPLRRLASKEYALVHTIRAARGGRSAATYDLQDAFFMPVSGFHTIERPGPNIQIFQLRAPSRRTDR
jgi:4-amino-4-deoxy-L-arabinose transferase-like glycosyltransferase